MLDQMDKINKAFMKAFEDQNPKAIGPLLTEDCKLMPTGKDVLVGRKGIYFEIVNYLVSLILRVRLEQIMLFKLPLTLNLVCMHAYLLAGILVEFCHFCLRTSFLSHFPCKSLHSLHI